MQLTDNKERKQALIIFNIGACFLKTKIKEKGRNNEQ
tara:strand:- start:270 stop:380 length:111 start_codon:yes stop_codon:yes gene_type:complete